MKCSRRGFLTSKDNPVYPIWPNGKIQIISWFKGSVFPWSVWRAVRELVEGKMPVFIKCSKSLQGKVRRLTLPEDGSVLPRPAWRTVGELESSSGNKGGVPLCRQGSPTPSTEIRTRRMGGEQQMQIQHLQKLQIQMRIQIQKIHCGGSHSLLSSRLNPQNKQIQKGIQNYRIQMQIYKYKNTNRRVGGHPLLLTKSAPAGWLGTENKQFHFSSAPQSNRVKINQTWSGNYRQM